MNRILVVDDEPDLEALLRQKFRRELREGRFAMLFARDGMEALEVMARNPDLDLVLADINMPRMDGLTLLGALQGMADPPATVIISAYGDMANIRTAMNRGAFDFLTKPIDFADLDATVAKTLRHIAERRENQARRLEAERARAALARYFSPNLAAQLAGPEPRLDLGGQRREVSAIFTDVAGFTALVETLEPAELAGLLNGYLGGMTDIVFAHGGTVAKVMGDGLLLLFGAPDAQADHAARALACALSLDAFAERFRMGREVALGVTRIGLHSGPALVGDFGAGQHFDYTAYGDSINIAARLEAANKVMGTRLLVSAAAAAQVAGFQGRPVGDLLLRGRSEPISVVEPRAGGEADAQAYGAAFALIGQDDAAALLALERLEGDPLARFHARRLRAGASGRLVDLR
ncbi:adenylate/guanylate cyclase domain-containing protein [Sediminicoccus sp. KRV36]|uniref:adenylate/guanylate cyclase domain-containing protein n=1 Tax=Sediminicoccus sp. KRV36 TaxID=3133721 RepID=UPI00200C8161|nr:adenylate/guanylate cyclase domain-containing protein [Sediminicoccus rosea]UPY38853.1 response regulator [Sediminicoccus rosea]